MVAAPDQRESLGRGEEPCRGQDDGAGQGLGPLGCDREFAAVFLAWHGLLHWAELHIGSGLAAVLIATEPLWILAIGAVMGRQRFNRANVIWLLQYVSPAVVATHAFVNRWSRSSWA